MVSGVMSGTLAPGAFDSSFMVTVRLIGCIAGPTVRLAAKPTVLRSDQWPGSEDQMVTMVAVDGAPSACH
jgi:hypothetical protein